MIRVEDEYSFYFCPDEGCDEGVLIPRTVPPNETWVCERGHVFLVGDALAPADDDGGGV